MYVWVCICIWICLCLCEVGNITNIIFGELCMGRIIWRNKKKQFSLSHISPIISLCTCHLPFLPSVCTLSSSFAHSTLSLTLSLCFSLPVSVGPIYLSQSPCYVHPLIFYLHRFIAQNNVTSLCTNAFSYSISNP